MSPVAFGGAQLIRKTRSVRCLAIAVHGYCSRGSRSRAPCSWWSGRWNWGRRSRCGRCRRHRERRSLQSRPPIYTRPGLVCLFRIRTRATTIDVSAASPNPATLGSAVRCSSSHGALWCTGRTACWPLGIGHEQQTTAAQHDRRARPQAPDRAVAPGNHWGGARAACPSHGGVSASGPGRVGFPAVRYY
jgi:hypothetical protein